MDADKLIGLVFEHKCLWDTRERNYHNRDISRQTWDLIAAEMGTSRETVKGKWRGLRDTYRKELIKYPRQQPPGRGPCKESSWRYFRSLEFLSDQFRERKSEVNLEMSEGCCDQVDESLKWEEEDATVVVESSSSSSSYVAQGIVTPPQSNVIQQHHPLPHGEDADYHFMMSLLPYLRRVPEHRKMAVRAKLQQVFCEEDQGRC